jgi:hypothetical protein
MPVTFPETSTVATEVLLLLHVPPVVVFDKAVDSPTHTLGVPVMAAGKGLTVTINSTLHPVPSVYVIAAVPADTPVTTPEVLLTVAIAVAPLLHVPPDMELASVVVSPIHTLAEPVIAEGSG